MDSAINAIWDGLQRNVELTLNDARNRDHEVIRACGRTLCYEVVYTWPIEDQCRLIELAIARLEGVRHLRIYQLVPTYASGLDVEIKALRSRLEILKTEKENA
jgi:hypothetical protein